MAELTVVEAGSALVAAPGLRDSTFCRTVVLITEHQASGSLGVVLNRPSDVAVRDMLPMWGPHVTVPQALYVGGPVQQRAALCVAALPAGVDADHTEGMIKVHGSLALVDPDADPDLMAPRLRGLRVFAGYAGWGQAQLADEINRGDWVVVPALPDDVLAPPDTDLWGRILRRQGMPWRRRMRPHRPGPELRLVIVPTAPGLTNRGVKLTATGS